MGYSPWGIKEWAIIEHAHVPTHSHSSPGVQGKGWISGFAAQQPDMARAGDKAGANNPSPGGMREIEDSQGAEPLSHRDKGCARSPAQPGTHLWSQETEEGGDGETHGKGAPWGSH